MMDEKRVQIGNLFVKLSARIFGGEVQANGINDSNNGNPDIIHWEKNQAYESKGSISSDHHKISPEQVGHYRSFIDSDFPLTDGEAYYLFWQHSKRGVSKFQGNKLEKQVVNNINRLLIVSLDIVEAGLNLWDSTGEDCSWGKTYMFKSSQRRALTYESEAELERMNLNPLDYNIESESINKGVYTYKWWNIPDFSITKITRKDLRGIERI